MAWVAVDHGIKAVDKYGLDGPVKKWRRLRRTIHDRMCENGYNPDVGAFVQAYGSDQVDASVLMMPLVGFLPPDDPRVRGTVAAIEDRLMHDGFVFRYDSAKVQDNLPPGGGVPALHVLVRRQPRPPGPPRQGCRRLRAAVKAPQ